MCIREVIFSLSLSDEAVYSRQQILHQQSPEVLWGSSITGSDRWKIGHLNKKNESSK